MITKAHARHLRHLIVKASESLTDTDALQAVELFAEWKTETAYTVGQRIRYQGKLYRCEQAHTSQSDWTPDITPAMWTEVAEPGEIPVWKQPTGAQDAYMAGDKVYYPIKYSDIYESLMDYNTYSPDAYPAGWRLIEE